MVTASRKLPGLPTCTLHHLRLMQRVPPKRQYPAARRHGATAEEAHQDVNVSVAKAGAPANASYPARHSSRSIRFVHSSRYLVITFFFEVPSCMDVTHLLFLFSLANATPDGIVKRLHCLRGTDAATCCGWNGPMVINVGYA
jgi:hypothetical protein